MPIKYGILTNLHPESDGKIGKWSDAVTVYHVILCCQMSPDAGGAKVKRTWKPQVAGVLDIITGILGLVTVLGLFVAISLAHGAFGFITFPFWIPVHTVTVLGMIAVPGFLLSLLVLIGGILAVQRKTWGLTLTSSMASLFVLPIFGLISTILIALAKDEFESTCRQTSPNTGRAF